jgi:hypothetical protein
MRAARRDPEPLGQLGQGQPCGRLLEVLKRLEDPVYAASQCDNFRVFEVTFERA